MKTRGANLSLPGLGFHICPSDKSLWPLVRLKEKGRERPLAKFLPYEKKQET